MKIFITGATGNVGSLVTKKLVDSKNEVIGLARSKNSEEKLKLVGATPLRGNLEDLDILKKGATESDATIHLGFVNNFVNPQRANTIDANAINAMGHAIKGTQKPLIVTMGLGGLFPNHILLETDTGFNGIEKIISRKSELIARQLISQGINANVVRLAMSVHGNERYGLVSLLIQQAKKNKFVSYFGNGDNYWNAVNVNDVADLFISALNYTQSSKHSLHVFNAVAEGKLPTKKIAETISNKLNLPLKQQPSLEFHNNEINQIFMVDKSFAGNFPVSNELTKSKLNWHPKGTGLLEDLKISL